MSWLKRFPNARPRRLRQAPWVRSLAAEHTLYVSDLIQPLFVTDGETVAIESMPDVQRLSIHDAVAAAQHAANLGIPAIALFPVIPHHFKDDVASYALDTQNFLCQCIRRIKSQVPNIGVIADVALDPYTTHGHDGLVGKHGEILNDETVSVLVKQAITLADAGCDVVAPSDMMDGRVGQIRAGLDDAGLTATMILSYSAKYASHCYGPFRDAVGSQQPMQKIDKATYQQDFHNSDEALHEIAMDIQEGADWIMIKPGMFYLDVVYRAKQQFQVPIAVYQVSGEYSMIVRHAQQSHACVESLLYESLIAMKRAGANHIVTYAASQMAQYLRNTR